MEEEFLTVCCNAKLVKKGRADYHCSLCDKDVTLYLFFYSEAVEKSKKSGGKT